MAQWVADAPGCTHLDMVADVAPSADGCEDCLRIGGEWVHLRMCLTCGHMGCCDQSPNRHGSKHATASGHPLMRSKEPGEAWGWCFTDEVWLDPAE
ncbi:MAG: UBP-type zinc finger domain-containing protein [Candidatus Limnocylindrales bacterium]